jgi:hypothetical protein
MTELAKDACDPLGIRRLPRMVGPWDGGAHGCGTLPMLCPSRPPAILLGCRPAQASHESPSWPEPRASGYLRAISRRWSRHRVASTIRPPSSLAISQQMRKNCGSAAGRPLMSVS